MTVVRAWLGNTETEAISPDGVPPSLLKTLIHSIGLNSTGTVAAAKVWSYVFIHIDVWVSML